MADFVLEPTRNFKDTAVISEEIFLVLHYQLPIDKDACFDSERFACTSVLP